ncbi:MAG TPA: heavy metal-binding domain-containing protein, partial [Vicinamibacterales bacterium]
MAIDPVCGMTVDPAKAAATVTVDGRPYFFCSKHCAAKFQADPKKYLDGEREPMAQAPVIAVETTGGLKRMAAPSSPAPAPARASAAPTDAVAIRYTCPMDPDVVSDQPGACPKCGMALEPIVTSITHLSDAENPELVDMRRRFWLAVVLGAPIFLVTMADMIAGGRVVDRIGVRSVNWIELALATPVVW